MTWNLILLAFIALTCQGASVVRVPFIGCKSDGQTGPVDAPHEGDKVVEIDAAMAQELAFYRAASRTSGRFTVARVIARVFPGYKAFVRSVIEEGISPASEYPFGPYPNDKLTYHGGRVVEFRASPHSEGLGTVGRLRASDDPIDGAAVLQGPTPDLLLLTIRLPSNLNDLTSVIIHQVEREGARPR
jgi:hypothetical protein